LFLCPECAALTEPLLCADCFALRDDALVPIASYTTAVEAGLARATLEGSGIHCSLANDAVVGVLPHLSNAFGGIKLLVRELDAEAALKLLAAAEPPATDEVAVQAEPAPQDPEESSSADEISPSDQVAYRAMKAAVIGLLILPVVLHLYSLVQLLKLGGSRGSLTRKGRTRAVAAATIDALVFAVVIAVVAHR
jgi:hypothetical protein